MCLAARQHNVPFDGGELLGELASGVHAHAAAVGEGDEALKDKVNSLVHQGRRKIVLNLAEVPYIDSAGLGEIVRTYTTVSRQGGSLKLLNLTKRIEDLLSITKLLTVFDTFDSEAEAIKSFTK